MAMAGSFDDAYAAWRESNGSPMQDENEPLGQKPHALVLVCALAALGGGVDTWGLMRLGDLNVSYMSGNTTALGSALWHTDWPRAALIGTLVALFIGGAAMGEMIAYAAGRWRLPVLTLLVAFILTIPILAPAWTIVAMVVAMANLNAGMHQAGGITISLTYVTGTLFRFGQGLGRTLTGQHPGTAWMGQIMPWLGLVIGAAAAAGVESANLDYVWLLPAYAAGLAGIALWMEW